jgi:hypothetical protein
MSKKEGKEDDFINKTLLYILKLIIGSLIIKLIPNNINNLKGITEFAIFFGLIISIFELLFPRISQSTKRSIFLILAIKILTL